MTYERPSPQDYEYESDYIEALERWLDRQEYYGVYTSDEMYESDRDKE